MFFGLELVEAPKVRRLREPDLVRPARMSVVTVGPVVGVPDSQRVHEGSGAG